jgi:hypothetical protein
MPDLPSLISRLRRAWRDKPAAATLGLCLLGWVSSGPQLDAQTALVNHGDSWRYRKGTNAPQSGWKTVADASLDATWLTGNGGFGYADNTTETMFCQTLLSDMRGLYSTVAMRKSFQVTSNFDASSHLVLTMDWDDGFIAWLDGSFLASAESPGSPAEPAFGAVATGLHESSNGDGTRQPPTAFDLGAIGARLAIGTHVLAIVGLNQSKANSSDFIQIADLTVVTNNPNCVSGPVTANTVWRATNSPISVCGNLTVESGVTLTIEAGVTVQLHSGIGITVANGGRLLAQGTAASPLRFMAASAGTSWDHLLINGAAGSPESRITYAHFESNVTDTGIPCIEVAAGTAFLDHLTFGNNAAPYIHVDGASFVISDCVFPSAADGFELVHGTGGIKSGGHGIFLRNFFGVPIGYNDVVDFTGGNRPGPIVQFLDNVLTGSQDDGLDLDGTDAWIEGNIFMHVHRNGNTPDSSSAVSGGNNGPSTSEITIVGNLFFDCDNAATAKQTNFFTLINNTMVHITKTGGIDGASGVVCVRDTTPMLTSFARGCYLEANIVVDTEQLVRNYDPAETTVTLNNNILPLTWTGPGTNNLIANPLLTHIPTLAETAFTSWSQAQIMRTWFAPQPGSPALGTGPNGQNKGGVIPIGISIHGEPAGTTSQTGATLTLGFNRSGNGMPAAGWPNGAGYVSYRWRLDSGAWSFETPIANSIVLSGLANGPHHVEVSGKRDSGLFQDDPLYGVEAVVTLSKTWTVQSLVAPQSSLTINGQVVTLSFTGTAGQSYSVYYRNAFDALNPWIKLMDVPLQTTNGIIPIVDPDPATNASRFYQLVTPMTTP